MKLTNPIKTRKLKKDTQEAVARKIEKLNPGVEIIDEADIDD